MLRRRLAIQGVLQGIGFRPLVYRLAHEQSLSGSVRNDGRGVVLELQGAAAELDEFAQRLAAELPPGGRIDRLHSAELPVIENERGFAIASSNADGKIASSLAPDRYVCPDCLAELRDPADRRYRYPFINCTRCGPRYTITRALPYDRPQTTMAAFPLCAACQAEYGDPLDRRYHAQPIACPACGPRLWLERAGADPVAGDDALREAASLLHSGRVVAVKGIGGFHLAVDAANADAVARLRQLKHRPRKPLALMVRDLETARRVVRLERDAAELLTSPAAPILLAPRRAKGALPDAIAPGLTDIGVMLPYSPLHHLLLELGPPILVLTSGNRAAEPITIENAEARADLGADAHLLHDRPIHVANDDSVVRYDPAGPLLVRRSRGYVPEPFDARALPRRSVLALGALLKVTVSTLQRGELVVGRHLGDLDNPRTMAAFAQELDRMLEFGRVEPEAIALDLHPDLASAEFARRRFPDLPSITVQHHHAHLAAVLIEHGLPPATRAAGIILDGAGYGEDGTVWGGEVLVGGYAASERVGRLRPVPLPGGDRAALEPRRMATSLLVDAGLERPDLPGYDPRIAEICAVTSVSPLTSSAGRLFDGAAALLGVAADTQDYEGEAAALLEAVADPTERGAYPLPAADGQLDTRVLIAALLDDRSAHAVRAARFHNGLADGLAEAALEAGVGLVVLGGGCMINRLLLRRLAARLRTGGARVLIPRLLPPGDGGISAGQAACAACRLAAGD